MARTTRAHGFVAPHDTGVFGPPSRSAADLAVYLDTTPTVVDTSIVAAKPAKPPLKSFGDPKLASEATSRSITTCRGAGYATTRLLSSVPRDLPPGSHTVLDIYLGETEVFQSPSRVDLEKYADGFVVASRDYDIISAQSWSAGALVFLAQPPQRDAVAPAQRLGQPETCFDARLAILASGGSLPPAFED